MKHYKARQHQETSKWKYTVENDGRIYEVGYCAEDQCLGHDTPEEAQEHYKQYLLDTRQKFYNPSDGHAMYKCEECGTFTMGHVDISNHAIMLCEKHQTREIVEKLFKVGESWSSY